MWRVCHAEIYYFSLCLSQSYNEFSAAEYRFGKTPPATELARHSPSSTMDQRFVWKICAHVVQEPAETVCDHL